MTIPAGKSRSLPRRIRWHQLWVIRGALLAAIIILAGYLASLAVAIEGVQSITRMAFDPEIEVLFGQHGDRIRDVHKLHKELVATRLRTIVPAVPGPWEQPPMATVIVWLEKAGISRMIPGTEPSLRRATAAETATARETGGQGIYWPDHSNLYLRGYMVTLPESEVRKTFQNTENLRLRYQGIRANWNGEIRPTLIQLQIVIVIVTVTLVLGMVWILARTFKKNIDALLDGFSQWSEKDSQFRFRRNWGGELKIIADHFNSMAAEVEVNRRKNIYLEKMASWQIIARKLAHEIKNPLTPIQMMVSQIVRRYEGDDAEFKKLLDDSQEIITEEVTGLKRMVDNFSRFARLPDANLASNDLVNLCRQVVTLEKTAFPDHQILFESRLDKAEAQVDDQLLRQVLINLIKNAGEACEAGKGHIVVGLNLQDGQWLITVRDNGPGIPEDLQKRVFEAYFTTKHTGPSPGMGLGLAICQKVMLDHGGEMQVTSQPGDTCFTLSIPA